MKEKSPFENKKISSREVYKAVAAYRSETGNTITFDLEIKGQIGLHIINAVGRQEFVGHFPNWKAYVMINMLTDKARDEKRKAQRFIVPTGARAAELFILPDRML
jgi:hypothetical protein